ncbi:hypothetical protein ERD78_19290 [Allopusillimonas soli]|uniref:PGAP1-like protein n=1 Tax=Allopusillimonas soli TaxID=659016 RepID=A0A853FH72_9BURK|nr:hypothetical protein [Allopusillimonas soli]NYT38992.1 hypothetical protein [Allopusillimonas soli]TEA69566.1 hypothetical protein ERD78_19290 [Allopusillimonas soli]
MAYFVPPFFPVVYVRGYAMTSAEIADTVSTPYMGFNLGATKARQTWDGKVVRQVFESPVVRLMKDYGYRDIYANGTEITGPIPARSIIIYRYYDTADKDFGDGKALSIPEAARGLRALLYQLRAQMCGAQADLQRQFKVHLVAHSMGGLVVRAFLQNDEISTPEDRNLVSKVFTYATPHNGIEMAGINVPAAFGLWDMNNFNRGRMAEYLDLPRDEGRVDTLGGKFDAQRFFCFVGTNHRDYPVAGGLARALAGEMSDGLVKIENATVADSPRAFAFRCHSGPYGVVNSEEGYQNLVRFLFGNLRVDGVLEVQALPLPPSVEKARRRGKSIRASYYFECSVSPRGALGYRLTERRRDTYSAILRGYDELLNLEDTDRDAPRWPMLFSAYLDTSKITVGRTVVFGVELKVSTTGYTINNKLWLDQHVEGEYLFRDTLTFKVTLKPGGFNLRYLRTDESWSEKKGTLAQFGPDASFSVPLDSGKGFKGTLALTVHKISPAGTPVHHEREYA